MTLFEPYGHSRIAELRREQVARKARLRNELGSHQAAPTGRRSPFAPPVTRFLRLMTRQWARHTTTRPNSRPAADS